MMQSFIPLEEVQEAAHIAGLRLVGISGPDALKGQIQKLIDWQQNGSAGEMAYMERDPELFVSPEMLLPEVKSIICFAVHYSNQPVSKTCQPGEGRVARYAWGKDYHRVLKKRLKLCLEYLSEHSSLKFKYRIFSDAVPLLERGCAVDSGLGFTAKNTMLIRPGEGSFFFLAEALLDVGVKQPKILPVVGSCGSCTRCLNSCPTKAFVSEYHLDARKCISYLSIEKRGILSDEESAALGDWVFGCDVCQEVCPFNHSPMKKTGLPEISEFEPAEYINDGRISLRRIFTIKDDKEFTSLFAGTPFMRAKREGLLRNACCVALNTRALDLVPDLINCLNDTSSVVRHHSREALSGIKDFLPPHKQELVSSALMMA